MPNIQLRISDEDPYLYLEPTLSGSAVIGTDDLDSNKLKIVMSDAIENLDPGSGSPQTPGSISLSIDPSVNGDIVLSPKGIGETQLFNGSLNIQANDAAPTPGAGIGNLIMPDTTAGGLAGVIEFGGQALEYRFIHNKGTDNTFVGKNAGSLSTTGNSSVAVGANALNDDTSLVGMTAVGFNALTALSAGIQNTAVGYRALASATSANQNTAVGYESLPALTAPGIGGGLNAAFGNASLRANTLGRFNTAIGCQALVNLNGNGSNDLFNAALGCQAGHSLTSGTNNTLVGAQAGVATLLGSGLLTGGNNVIVGAHAGQNYTGAESSNILISHAGTVGESDAIHLGTEGVHNKAFIAGITGTTVTAAGTVVINSSGQLGISSNLPIATPVTVPNGGTGRTTLTNHGVLVGAAASAITQLSVGTNGQVLLGSTAADPVFATLTSSGGTITFTPGAGTLNLESSGFTWSVITANQTAAVNNGYICNKGGNLALLLPSTSAAGSTLRVTGMNTALGWSVTQAAGQQVHFGTLSTTSGAGGSLSSTNIRDSIELVCVVANLTWNVIDSIGNITVV